MARDDVRRSAWRSITVLAIALFAMANTVTDVALFWHPFSDLGLTLDASHAIIGIDPGRSAARAGLRVGDRIDDRATPASTRRYLATGISAVPEGQPLTVAVRGPGGARSVVLTGEPHPRSLADNVTNLFLLLAVLATILIGGWLVLVRTSKMTWAFFLYCAGSSGGAAVTTSVALPDAIAALDTGLYGALVGASVVPFAIFALRFPDDRAAGWRRIAQRALLASLVVLVPLGAYGSVGPTFAWPVGVASSLTNVAQIVGLIFVAIIFLLSFLRASAPERAKIRWVALGTIVGYAGQLAFAAGTSIPGLAFQWSIPAINLVQALEIAVPLSVAYVIVRHRVFDVRFVLGRAAVYGTVTSVVIAGVTFLDYLVAKLLSQTQLAVVGDAAVAILVGLSLSGLHKRVEAAIERVFFRNRRQAEERLRRVGEGLMRAESSDAIARALVDETTSALHLISCAIFRRDHGTLVRRAAVGWPGACANVLPADASAVLALGARREPLAIRDGLWPADLLPAGDGAPLYALPIVARDRLEAILFVGAHTGGEQLDPEERALLGTLCEAAAAAFEHVDATDAIARASSLELEVATLQRVVTGIAR